MLVIEQAKVIALHLDNPERVLDCIPTAKQITLRGSTFTAVPHRSDEVRVLRTLGIRAPAPILHYYGWPGNLNPYQHQSQTAAFLTMNRKALVLNEIGTGKTHAALWAADYLIAAKEVAKVLVVSPLSTLERVWGDAIFTEFHHRSYVTMTGTAKRRHKMLAQDVDFYIINHDGFSIISEAASGKFDLVIVDEAAVLRNPSTIRFRLFRNWMRKQAPDVRLWLMTGTPTPNNPTDAWALARLVDNPYIPRTFTAFRDQTMTRWGMHSYLPKNTALDTVKYVLQPAVRYTRDDCFDLPPTVYQTHQVALTKPQRDAYNQMMKDLVVDMAHTKAAGDKITAVNEAVKVGKLVQIACGVAYDDAGNTVELPCGPRVAETCDIIEQVGGKVIVFVPLTGVLKMLEREISKRWPVAIVNGSVSMKKRNIIFYDFQHSSTPHVIIAHPATMAHGLTLTSASTIIWYGPITSNEQYVQANGRIERIGKHHTSNIVHLIATKLEQKMYDRLRLKQKLQGILLDLIQEEMGEEE